MKALTWHGRSDVRCESVPDPAIVDPTDAIVRITSTAICGSDLHLYDGFNPFMEKGDVLGHEPMGIVEEVGSEVRRLRPGDRVVVPFTISCGSCWACKRGLFSVCQTTNRNAELASKLLGHTTAGLFGYSHLTGGFAGGQAQYLRVPYADVGPIRIDSDLTDEQVLLLSDIFPTGWMAAENADIETGDTVAVWGAGPVGQLTIQSAWLMGAGRVIAIDRVPERLELARNAGRAETIDIRDASVYEALQEMTGGRGPDRCIDAVGLEAHGAGSIDAVYDKVKTMLFMETDRAHVIREAIYCCRPGGTVSIPGVYTGFVDKFPLGAVMNKGLALKAGQTHVQRYLEPLLQRIEKGEIDPSFIITHTVPIDKGPEMYRTFRAKEDGCIKVVVKPWD
ncbi:MAG: zinc-dependent alcohol dehydrogenase [Longimicrobiales bacterium]